MKRIAYATLVILSLSLTTYKSFAADAPDRPAGVTAANWVPVSDRVGIVLVQSETPVPVTAAPGSQPLLLKPPVSGYYMVKGANGWTRLIIVEPVKGPGDVG
jgi:hypothetical protein